jgi:hypothetical protein
MENFTMKYSKQLVLVTTLLASSMSQAFVIDFATLANTSPGESAWKPLVIAGSVNLTINGYNSAGLAFAYLDAKTGGLGVCGEALSTGATDSSANQCDPSSDDNVHKTEYLTFNFDQSVFIDNLWFNNNHDGGLGSGNYIDIDGVANGVSEATKNDGIGSWFVAAGTDFKVAHHVGGCPEESTYSRTAETNNVRPNKGCSTDFYVERMEFTLPPPPPVPEPGSLALLGLGIAGLGFMRRKLA